MAIQRLLLLLPVAGAAFVAASPLPRPASVRPVLPRASVPVAVVPPPLAAALPPAVSTLRGGLLAARAPESLFNLLFLGLSGACAALVVGTRSQQQSGDSDTPAEKPEMVKAVSALKWRFLAVFWLYKMADWLQGPYFYDVYASKIINGVQVNSEGVARLFLMGFGSTAVFGAAIGGLVDSAGRKRGSLAFALMYTLSALSTRASTLPLLLGGRLVGGIGTSLLFSVRRRAARFCGAIHRAILWHFSDGRFPPPAGTGGVARLRAHAARAAARRPLPDLRPCVLRRQPRRDRRRAARGRRPVEARPRGAVRAVDALPRRRRRDRRRHVGRELWGVGEEGGEAPCREACGQGEACQRGEGEGEGEGEGLGPFGS